MTELTDQPSQPDPLTDLVNIEANRILALAQAELDEEEQAALRRAGAEQTDPEEYLKTVRTVAASAKKRAKQQPLRAKYLEEMQRANGMDARLLVRSKYRRQGLDV